MNLTVSKILILAQLSRGEHGLVVSMSTLLLTVMLGLGVVGGLVVVPDHLVQELGDFGVALDNQEQSFYHQTQVCDYCAISAEHFDDPARIRQSRFLHVRASMCFSARSVGLFLHFPHIFLVILVAGG